ncbi:SDR family NAD(P)-dependent oxidoreductase [Flavihumibacter profundi]|uniref:SDR family NAD(P)-dependent oxidoreductase n=1 Tax=Flavihumibacter profundi TaxID=2716883 RepID=UPI001CC46AFC|nr:SDR family oxidoreductase [Flavihumibacter profundi]MBZ5856873.1 SDR family oxidoreductase [Flavihumibacter profundi]
MANNLANHTAIVTGAASGIGKEIAFKLLDSGVTVYALDLDEKKLHEYYSGRQDKAVPVGIDVTDEKKVNEVFQEIIQKAGKVEILVNCVGITGETNIQSHLVDTANLQKVFNINFMASFYTSKAILPHMVGNKYGRVLHLASIAGKEGNAGMLAYSASKAAMICMAKVQGKEYAETGVTVNALAPAVIRTPLVDMMPEKQVTYMTEKIPMKRCGTLEEAANLALYIVSPANSFTTGFTFDLSGGRATY